MGLLAGYRRSWGVVAVALLTVPMALQPFGSNRATVSEREARVLAPLPERPHTLAAWRAFPHAIEQFLVDHFGLRDTLVRANALLRYFLASPTNLGVVYGRDKYLFFNGDGMLQQSMGLLRRERDISTFADFAAAYRQRLKARGIELLVTVPPNSATIIREHLPEWAARPTALSEYDLTLQALAGRGVAALDLRPALRAAEGGLQTYRRLDTHWTRAGALIAFNAVVDALGRPDWKIDPRLVIHGKAAAPTGDLARMLGISADVGDDEPDVELSTYAPRPLRTTAFDTHQRETGGSVTETGRDGPAVLVLGDSFTERYWREYFGLHASRYIFMHHELCGFVPEIAEAQHPEIVILAPTERFMFCWNRSG